MSPKTELENTPVCSKCLLGETKLVRWMCLVDETKLVRWMCLVDETKLVRWMCLFR